MMVMAMMLAAATMTVGLQKAATLMTGQQKLTSAQRVSMLANMSPEEKKACLGEHERVGKALAEEFGFGMGKDFKSYKFLGAQTNANLVLPKPTLGFAEFLPIVTEKKLCGLYLKQAVPRDEKGRFSLELFETARETSRTNLAERLILRTDELGFSTNNVPHAWRISYEQWRETLVLRICDEELSLALLVAAEEKRKAEAAEKKAAQLRKIREESGTSAK